MKQQPQITFQQAERRNYPEWSHRPGTHCVPMRMNFMFINGGMGDYICWIPAIRWLASEATWIDGNLIVPKYFRELAEYWLKDFPRWRFSDYTRMEELPNVNEIPFRGPVELNRESLNATGAHLLTCGWVYFTNKEKAPPGWDWYPTLKQTDLDALELPPEAAGLQAGSYVVLTTGMTTNSRKVPPGGWLPVIEHIRTRGLTPVFLGKSVVETGNAKNVHTAFDKLPFDKGVDLRDKTTLLQAAAVMSRAACVVGHDNGLLHLAACTEVPIVFGYNLAAPEHREPRRPVGKTYNVHLAPGELGCNFCQSKFNFVIGYNFRECFYSDRKCMDMLFENKAERWTRAIDRALAQE